MPTGIQNSAEIVTRSQKCVVAMTPHPSGQNAFIHDLLPCLSVHGTSMMTIHIVTHSTSFALHSTSFTSRLKALKSVVEQNHV